MANGVWNKNQTYLGWLEVSRTHLASLGEFGKLHATIGASNLGLTSLQVCLLYYPIPVLKAAF
jgi:hypothetical protein